MWKSQVYGHHDKMACTKTHRTSQNTKYTKTQQTLGNNYFWCFSDFFCFLFSIFNWHVDIQNTILFFRLENCLLHKLWTFCDTVFVRLVFCAIWGAMNSMVESLSLMIVLYKWLWVTLFDRCLSIQICWQKLILFFTYMWCLFKNPWFNPCVCIIKFH